MAVKNVGPTNLFFSFGKLLTGGFPNEKRHLRKDENNEERRHKTKLCRNRTAI